MKHPYPVLAAIFAIVLVTAVFINAGLPAFIIFASASSIAYVLWLLTTYRRPADPERIVPLYLVALAAQVLHTVEEFVSDFPGELAALFGTEPFALDAFVVAVMGVGSAIWILTAVGLIYRNPFANYLLWFFLIGPGVINSIAHFSFPFIGGVSYFPGVITVLLPTIMSIVVIVALVRGHRAAGATPGEG